MFPIFNNSTLIVWVYYHLIYFVNIFFIIINLQETKQNLLHLLIKLNMDRAKAIYTNQFEIALDMLILSGIATKIDLFS